jgi:hypothetical protein
VSTFTSLSTPIRKCPPGIITISSGAWESAENAIPEEMRKHVRKRKTIVFTFLIPLKFFIIFSLLLNYKNSWFN